MYRLSAAWVMEPVRSTSRAYFRCNRFTVRRLLALLLLVYHTHEKKKPVPKSFAVCYNKKKINRGCEHETIYHL